MSLEEQQKEFIERKQELAAKDSELAAVESALHRLAPKISLLGKTIGIGNRDALQMLAEVDFPRLQSLLEDWVRLTDETAQIKRFLERMR